MADTATIQSRLVRGFLAGGLLCTCLGCGESQAPVQPAGQGEASADAELPPQGLELGRFDVREYHPVEGKKSMLRFTLHASVAERQADQAAAVLANREHKLRDEVITAVRMVPTEELDSPSLTELRRRILLRLQRHMPELKLADLYISDFQLEMD